MTLDELNAIFQSSLAKRARFMAPHYRLPFFPARRKGPITQNWPNLSATDIADRLVQIAEQQKKDPTSNYGLQSIKFNASFPTPAPVDDDSATLFDLYEKETGNTLPRTFTDRRGKEGRSHRHFLKTCAEQDVYLELVDSDGNHLGEWRGAPNIQTVGPGCSHPSGDFYEVTDTGSDDIERAVFAAMPDAFWNWMLSHAKPHDIAQPNADDSLPRQRHPDLDPYDFLETHCRLKIRNVKRGNGGTYYHLTTCPRIGKPHASHNSTSTALVLTDNGSLGFQCNSSGCDGYTLASFLDWVEKEHGEYRNLWLINLINPDFELPLAEDWIKNNVRVVRRTDDNDWLGYHEGIWIPHDGPQHSVQEYLKTHAGEETENLTKLQYQIRRQLLSRRLASNVSSMAACNPKLRIERSQFDRDPLLAGLPGGRVLDLRTGATRPSVPEDFISKKFTVMPGRPDHCPKWLDFMQTTHPDADIRDFLQVFLGLCLTGIAAEILVFLTDAVSDDNIQENGGRGKGTMLSPFIEFMGDYYRPLPLAAISSDSNSDRHATSLASLPGARLAVLTETPAKSARHQSASFSNEALKKLSGADRRIQYRRMRGNPAEFDPVFKAVILANKPPRLDEVEGAIRQRIVVVPFTQSFRGTNRQNPKLKDELNAELPGILAWALIGTQKFLAEGLKPPEVIKAASQNYANEADTFEAWLQEKTTPEPKSWCSTESLFRDWQGFCESRSEEASDMKWFVASLREHRKVKEKINRVGISNKQKKGFEGICLKEDV